MPFLILYFTNGIKLENYVLIFAPAIVLAALFTVFYGRLIDKEGFVKTSIISLSLYIVGLVLLGLLTDIVLVFIGTLFMMMGYLSLTACFNAAIRDNTPKKEIGLFQGIRIFVSVLIPMLIGPWIGSFISNGGSSNGGFLGVAGDDYTPSSLIFIAGAIVGLLTFIIVYVINYKKGDFCAELQNDDALGE